MHPLLLQLRELSEVDALILQTREQLALYPKMLKKLTGAEDVERAKADGANAQLDAARKERRDGEQEVAALRGKIKKLLAQQSMVKTTKEFETLTHELDAANQQIDALETRGLELLDQEETLGKTARQASTQLARLEAEQAEEKQRIASQIRDKQERLARLESEQARRLAELPDDWRQDYALMNARMPGTVAVAMTRGQCGGCHFALPPGVQQRVRAGETVIRCDHCRRVLFEI